MATILLQAAGAYLGGFLGSVGGAVGSAVGALAGYALDRALINGTQRIEGPRLANARPFSAEEGAAIPRLYGTARLGGTLIWATRFEESRSTSRQGKLGPKVTEFSYYANAAFLLCEGEIAGIRRVWADGREIDRETVELRIYRGGEDQPPDPLLEAKQGLGNTPAYRGVAYVVVDRLDIGGFGNRIPQLQFEVIRPVGKLHTAVKAVALLPGATEYGLSPKLVTRQKRPGEQQAVNRNMLFAGTDIAASLDELQMTCPNLKHVALVVTWFGDDLRAGHCRIRPAVTSSEGGGLSADWCVSGIARQDAMVVSQHDGGAAYGGTPSDRSVLDAIAEIKTRGLGVTLYPFVMMDIAEGNELPDPYGGANQSSYPWRGRISCDPAPLQPETADKTTAARAQVAAFSGAALASQFADAADTVSFSGASTDWGYRRFVLHYAHLASKAGGVDAFLLGSELRGLTTVRDDGGAFAFVEQLADLATDVRSILGPATGITYGADWSEYFGHHPADGSGDVYFHLDPLWAHPAIDAVGIDNYMPLSDWRDADYAGDNPDGFAGPCDPKGLGTAIGAGEGFDWYYESDEARAARQRSPITDGAYEKPWVFRYKDIVSWWSNPHFDRNGGVEISTPTAWVARSKPIWFTELGCPAADKGPNQPNMFPDPKSTESGVPHFSNGGRSDIAQRRFIEAHMEHWSPAATGFDEEGNPLSEVYGRRMLDLDRAYLWAWDARPFPAFPQRIDVWSDGANWTSGHWLNGRLASPDIASLVNAILADHGQQAASVDDVEGTVHGYVVADPSSARAALEPLVDLFDLAVIEKPGGFIFRTAGARQSPTIEISELAGEEGGALIETVRNPDHEFPAEALLTFTNPMTEYQTATARTTRLGAAGSRQRTIVFPGVIETGQANALVEDWLRRVWYQRETVRFAVAQPNAEIAPGAIVRLPALGSHSDFLITSVEDGLVRRISARQISFSAPSPWRDAKIRPAAIATLSAGQPHAVFLDLPKGIGEGSPAEQFRVAVWQKPWRSQILFASPELTGFVPRGAILKPATLGRLLEPLASGVEGRLSCSQAILVELFYANVSSVSTLQLLNGANAAAVKSVSGAWEVLQFQDAEELAPQQWRLSGLLRGQLGTNDAMAAGAAVGADFAILDDGVVSAGLSAAEVGLELNWRVCPSGSEVSDLQFATSSQIGGVRAQLPLSQVHLTAKWSAGDLLLSWVRRGRVDADSWEALEIPLGEEREEYRLEIAGPGGPVVRTEMVGQQQWLYPAAAFALDFAVAPPALDITVRQSSNVVGWGIPASARVVLT
ncbi:host specificity protein [Mesorhizobium sp. Root157]|uniref:baseplate multidomain protein megatron n=1 Tax=Mesorhizobium sp. Root157 TaxID=1736477 RepID=UPI0006F4D882|nr:glycoside hydrolase/phage tail family protein [Mesorhizobium sp. Root157]KQZ94204.1 host specificity protein [Mesorhizobium sp. Root157]